MTSRRLRRVSTLSLRVRLVAGFAAAMLVVLTAAGTFVYWRVKYALDQELNNELIDTSIRLAARVTPSGHLRDESDLFSGERYQVLDVYGHVLSQSSSGSTSALLSSAVARAALSEPILRDIGELLPGTGNAFRVYAVAVDAGRPGPASVLVVAAERSQRDEALRELLAQLLVAGLATLLVTAVVGERLAKASLRPVERYRRQAADIADGATGVRLDVPPHRDDEITRLGHTLNDMLVGLEEALEHERRFVNDASHELRTPLTLIRTRVQLARRRRRSVEQHEVVLDEVQTDIIRLSQLADELLEIGASRDGTNTNDTADLAAVARAEVERRRALASADDPYGQAGSLEVLTSGPTPVAVHRTRLEQVVGNLLDNAAVHGRPPVTVTVDHGTDTARLVLTDTGSGMDETTLASAPQRFVRAIEARNRPGSGLGLALVHAAVLAAGGELRLCFHGKHESFGEPLPVECQHSVEMTVTLLLPLRAGTGMVNATALP